jgi:hypothetical protein
MLDLSYDTSIDTNYPSFMDRFIHTHALYLFVQWHTHFTIDELKLIVSGTEHDFQTKHATIIATHHLTLPSIVSDEHKFMLLQRGLFGSHLHDSLNSYNQHTIISGTSSSSSSTTPTDHSTFTTLNSILLEVDSKKMATERKSADSHFRLDNRTVHPKCKMCIMAKQILGIHDISFHADNTPCPQKNIDAMAKLVKPPKTVTVTDLTKSTQGRYVPLPLPPGFDTARHCSVTNLWYRVRVRTTLDRSGSLCE